MAAASRRLGTPELRPSSYSPRRARRRSSSPSTSCWYQPLWSLGQRAVANDTRQAVSRAATFMLTGLHGVRLRHQSGKDERWSRRDPSALHTWQATSSYGVTRTASPTRRTAMAFSTRRACCKFLLTLPRPRLSRRPPGQYNEHPVAPSRASLGFRRPACSSPSSLSTCTLARRMRLAGGRRRRRRPRARRSCCRWRCSVLRQVRRRVSGESADTHAVVVDPRRSHGRGGPRRRRRRQARPVFVSRDEGRARREHAGAGQQILNVPRVRRVAVAQAVAACEHAVSTHVTVPSRAR